MQVHGSSKRPLGERPFFVPAFRTRSASPLSIDPPPVANKAAFFDTQGIVVGPMHKTAQIVPFIHAANAHTITETDRHSFRKIDIVGDQQRFTVTDIEDKTLVSRTVIVVRQQLYHDAPDLDPATSIGFAKTIAQATPS